MSKPSELSHRARQILYAAITEFVASGEPVGSRTLSKKAGIDLSPASIRNVLADLEDAGYLQQPHTSAGRVPTDRAFRLFIDALMEVKQVTAEDHTRIRVRFEELGPGQNVMRETGRLLSELTGNAAVVVSPRAEVLTLKTLRFLKTSPNELLAVMVMSNGSVQNRFIRGNDLSIESSELERVHNLLDDVTEGRSLGDLREFFARKLQTERVQHDELRRRAFSLGGAAMIGAVEDEGREQQVVIEGQAKLFKQPEFAGAEGMKQLVSAFDERERLVHLLDATLEAGGTMVVVGREAGEIGGGQLSIVGASYMDHGRTAGTVAVIGPTRMDYPKVVPLVSATAHAMSAFMDRDGREAREARSKDDDDR
ncbi:MAG: Heat-inducible transcription repressor HrcA [Myxococcaceae bacterium]|nr:Heat-inducible transcription repressor HrcA [Myxococcaceae bacterium]